MKKYLIKFSLILVSILVTVLFCELLIRIFYSQFKNYNLEMWRYAVELKKPLPNANLPFHHNSGSSGNFYGVDITTNSYGFRDHEYTLEKNDSVNRILFIGDSFTLGWGVSFDSIYSKALENRLNQEGNYYEVINTGIGNYNSKMEVELFKLKGLQFEPDIVILMYFVNDVEPIPEISKLESSFISNSYLFAMLFDKVQKLKVLSNKGYSWESYYNNLYSKKNSKALNQNRESLQELIRLCNDEDIELIFVNIPELHKLKDYPIDLATNYIENIAKEGHIKFINLLNYIQDYKPEDLWVSNEDTHANAKANYIFANVIYEYLVKWELVH